MNVIVGITGATGVVYGIRLLEELKKYDIKICLVVSKWAEETIRLETNYELSYIYSLADTVFDNNNLAAAISSGSFQTIGMIVAPCSMKTLSGIANGYTDNLVVRAADVVLKEKRKLILLARETPLNIIHLDNMVKAAQAGAIIMPPVPSFYTKPESIDDIINHTVGRVLDMFGFLDNKLVKRWN